MIDQNTDFFAYVDNFAKIEGIESVKVFGNEDSSAEYTIAIPTYKRTEYLKEAIDSALNQDCSFSYNVIVVDNNPERNDDTEKMMASYKNTKNLSYYKNAENLGMAGNWNRLFQLSKTKWVVMLHDDDVLYLNYLSTVDGFILKVKDAGILKPKEDRKDEPKTKIQKKVKRLSCLDFYYGNAYGTPSGMLFNKEKVVQLGGYNQEFYPSLDYCFNVLFSSNFNFYLYDEPLMFYRIGVNESLKVETQKQWLIIDSYLIRQLLSRYKIPKWIIDSFVSRRTINSHVGLQNSWNNRFDFNIEDVGLTKVSSLKGLFSHLVIRIYKFFEPLINKMHYK